MKHPERPPDVAALLAALDAHGVECVLVGSVAARAYGAEIQPGDLDVVPSLERANLERLAAMLESIEASISGRIGVWTLQENGERRWIEADETPAEHAARAAAWAPDPDDVATFDHLFMTRHGNFDTPPEICGTYEALAPRARAGRVAGVRARIAHVDDLLERLTVPRRAKDVPRVAALRAAQRAGRTPGD